MTVADPGLPLLHTRSYDVSSYRESDTRLRIRGRVHDVKPAGLYLPEDPDPMSIHQMVVDVVVEFPSLIIVDAQVVMETHPHPHCVEIVDHYKNLIGLSITRGFTHKVRELFGGPRGCTHTTALLQAMAPVAIQSMWSMMASAEGETAVEVGSRSTPDIRERMQFNRNTCHVWSEDGPMFSLLDQGEDPPPPLWVQERMEKLGLDPADWHNRRG
jgi:hypothetical protein